ncbi:MULTISPECIES: hypothetical protein [unclassified Streptomyces]|uniref:hypothetical protein n=2 Tax=unclassified Streptomyces TaxID=2593676 RepID=UPI002E37881D|nr:hypothetical protein [Streptomyces sp. NBC_01280]
MIVGGLGENTRRELDTQAREPQEYLGIGMFAKAGITCLGKFVTGLEGCFELLQQSEKLPAEGVLDSRGLVNVLGSQDTTQAANLRLSTADGPTRLRAERN